MAAVEGQVVGVSPGPTERFYYYGQNGCLGHLESEAYLLV